jgi:hypothetical protein
MTKAAKLPSHRVYAVIKENRRTFWHPIGAVWPHSDGDGFSLKLDYLPLNGAELVIRKPKPKDAKATGEESAEAEAEPIEEVESI